MRRRAIVSSGVFLFVVGSIFHVFGMWHAWMYEVSSDIPLWNLLYPEAGGGLLSLMGLSSSAIVSGIIFLLWAYKLPKE